MSVDPKQWQAIEMHYIQGVPIESGDPEKEDMVRELDATEGEIRHLIRYGIKAIRRAFFPPEPGEAQARQRAALIKEVRNENKTIL